MMVLATTVTTLVVAVILYVAYGLDDWLGLLAYKPQYLALCVLVACGLATLWLDQSKRAAYVVGFGVFTLLVSPYLAAEPSARILRGVLIDVQPGMEADRVVALVESAYQDSDYEMPRIEHEAHRIFVSLLAHPPGHCTAAIILLEDGKVVKDRFSAD